MLLQIREFILREGVVSAQQLTRAFHLDLAALQPMLDLWLDKGVIRKVNSNGSCQSTCFKCITQLPEYYQSIL